MAQLQPLNPQGLPDPRNRYTHIVKAGNLVFIAGQVSADAEGNVVGEGDITAQAWQVYANLKTAVESVGGTAANIVKTTTYIVDRDLVPGMRPARDEFFGGILPTTTLLIVAGLGRPELLLEVDAVAILDD